MEKDFFDVFPHLKVKKELEELLDMVFVTKVSMNPGRTHLRVYIESSRWIHKKNIFALEDEIERQCFPGIPMTVTVVEKFHLSEQYTPENFLESYRSSMEMELRNYNMLEYNLFRRSKIIFTGKDTLRMELPDTVISRQKSEILVEYFHKDIFHFLFDLKCSIFPVFTLFHFHKIQFHFRSNRKWKMS